MANAPGEDELLNVMGGGSSGTSATTKPPGAKQSYAEIAQQVHMPKPLFAQLPPGQKAIALFKRAQKQPWFQAIVDYTKLPAEGVVNLLGGWQRIAAQQLADQAEGKVVGPYEKMVMNAPPPISIPGLAVTPRGRQQLQRDVYAATHPNDPTPEQRAESAAHLERLMSKDPGLMGQLQNLGVKTAFQTLIDPLSYTGAGTAALSEKVLKAYDLVSRMALISKNPIIRTAAKTLGTNVPEKIEQVKTAAKAAGEAPSKFASAGERLKYAVAKTKAVAKNLPQDQQTIAAINSARNKAMDVSRRMESSDAQLIDKYRRLGWFKNATVGDWLRKNAEYMQKSPLEPHPTGVWPKEIEQRLSQGRPGQAMSLFRLPEPPPGVDRDVWEHSDAEAVLRQMLTDSREMIRRNTVQDALHTNTKNLTQEQIASIANVKAQTGGGGLLHKISRAQVDAMLTSGIPHMRNVGVAGYMSLGEAGVAKAAFYAIHNAVPDAMKQRLAKLGIRGMPEQVGSRLREGGTTHFGLSEPGEVVGALQEGVPGFRQFRKVSTGALDKWDEALRAVRLEQLDKQYGNAMTDFEKMDRVNQDLGAYNLRPKWTEWAPAVGANFPQWHGYIVPTMLARAMLRNPGRIGRFGRYETNFNDQFFPNQPYRWTFGGPIDEGFSAAADPLRVATGQYPSYFGGPSTLGAGSLILRPSYVPMVQRAIEFGAGAIPFGTALTEGYFGQFPQIPAGASTSASLAGFYTQKRPPSSLRRTAAEQRGRPQPQPQAQGTAATGKAAPGEDELLKVMGGGSP